MPKGPFTATKAEGYKVAMTAVTGLTTLKPDVYSGPMMVYPSTSATPPDIATGDATAISITAAQGWLGRTLAEVFPDGTTYTHLHIRAVNAQAQAKVYYA